jgi:hypothetical protein
MLLIFLDTEFTEFYNPDLISLGLASLNGKEFYAEVPFTRPSCSQFVLDVVLPLLSGAFQVPIDDLHKNILNWFDSIREDNPVIICFDSIDT